MALLPLPLRSKIPPALIVIPPVPTGLYTIVVLLPVEQAVPAPEPQKKELLAPNCKVLRLTVVPPV